MSIALQKLTKQRPRSILHMRGTIAIIVQSRIESQSHHSFSQCYHADYGEG